MRLVRRDATWKSAEILLLRYQLAVLQRQLDKRVRPKVSWADRALIALLLSLIPKAHRRGLRLIVGAGRTVGDRGAVDSAVPTPGGACRLLRVVL